MKYSVMPRLGVIVLSCVLLAGVSSGQTKQRITFLEIGSVGCAPCEKMKPIMKSIEARYGSQIKVIFHDVRKDKSVVEKYKVNLIPTQVFLDSKGKEIHRHVGYYPEAKIDKFLIKRGLKPKP